MPEQPLYRFRYRYRSDTRFRKGSVTFYEQGDVEAGRWAADWIAFHNSRFHPQHALGGVYEAMEIRRIEKPGRSEESTIVPLSIDVHPKETVLKHTISTLDLSTRAYNCLVSAGIRTIGDLVVRTEQNLSGKVRGFGKISLAEVKQALDKLGLCLGMKPSD